jgi:chemotaxis signal transduction protein
VAAPSKDHAVADEMRRAFDASFAAPPRTLAAVDEAILVRARGLVCGFATSGLRGLVRAPRVVPLPSLEAAVVGIVGIGGAIVPVLSLATLLGAVDGARAAPTWLVLVGDEAASVALGVDHVDGPGRAPALGDEPPAAAPRFVRVVESTARGPVFWVDVDAVFRAWGPAAPSATGEGAGSE